MTATTTTATTTVASAATAATADEDDRRAISFDVDRRSVVVAGAGSGKTTHLVQRVAETIRAGVDPSNVAVITFTEKAARELVHRLRGQHIDGVDDAYIGTIHGFCAAILRRYPIEAGLPPKFTTADEITSRTDAADRRRQMLTDIYDAAEHDPELLDAFAVVASEVGLGALGSVVDVIDSQWHRFEELDVQAPGARSLDHAVDSYLESFDAFTAIAKSTNSLATSIAKHEELRPASRTLISVVTFKPPGLSGTGGTALKEQRDGLAEAWVGVKQTIAQIVIRRIVAAFRASVVVKAHERIANGQLGYDDLLILTERLVGSHAQIRDELRDRYRRIFVDEFQDTDAVQFAIIEQLTRPDDGVDMAMSPRLFAVGDPKQSIYSFRNADVELFGTLAANAAAGGFLAELTANFRTRAGVARWINTTMERRFADAGGGPSQRGEADSDAGDEADVPDEAVVRYEALQPTRPFDDADRLDPGPPVLLLGVDGSGAPIEHPLTANAQEQEAADIVGVAARALDEGWRVLEAATRDEQGRPLTWTSRSAKYSDIAVLVARRTGLATLESAFRNAGIAYRVEGGTLAYEHREVYELLRVLRAIDNPADELMLVTALRSTILGCSDADLFAYRYRRASGRGRWSLSAQRSGSPDRREPPDPLDTSEQGGVARVEAALAQIAAWSAAAHRISPAVLLTTIYDWSMGVAAARFEGMSARVETWRRVRFLVDEARSWTDEVGGTLHEYLTWVEDKVEAVDRTEIAPDETDDDSVRILTIHAAKGLEFPIVVVAALGNKDNTMEDRFRLAVVGGHAEFKLGSLRSPRYPGRDLIAQRAEEARLLYVAMTRAQDHLVLSMHTSKRSSPNTAQRLAPHVALEGAELWGAESSTALRLPLGLADILGVDGIEPVTIDELPQRPDRHRRTVWTPSGLAGHQRSASGTGGSRDGVGDDVPFEGSHAEIAVDDELGDEREGAREGARAIEGHRMFADDEAPVIDGGVAGAVIDDDEAVDPGLYKDPPSGREPSRSRGRYGTDIGIAVHEVLQLVDLVDPDAGFDDLVTIACDNVDLVEPARSRVRRLARSVIDSPLFGRMRAASFCEREVYVGTTVGDEQAIALWGYIDAVFACDDGSYAIVDFKTDSVKTSPDQLTERYGIQLNAYGVAVERSTGGVVSELWLLVADPGGNAQQVPIVREEPRWPSVDRVADTSEPVPPAAPAPVDIQSADRVPPGRPEQLTLL